MKEGTPTSLGFPLSFGDELRSFGAGLVASHSIRSSDTSDSHAFIGGL